MELFSQSIVLFCVCILLEKRIHSCQFQFCVSLESLEKTYIYFSNITLFNRNSSYKLSCIFVGFGLFIKMHSFHDHLQYYNVIKNSRDFIYCFHIFLKTLCSTQPMQSFRMQRKDLSGSGFMTCVRVSFQ